MRSRFVIVFLVVFFAFFNVFILDTRIAPSDLLLENIDALAQHGEYTGNEPLDRGYTSETIELWFPGFEGTTKVRCCKYTGSLYDGCSIQILGKCNG